MKNVILSHFMAKNPVSFTGSFHLRCQDDQSIRISHSFVFPLKLHIFPAFGAEAEVAFDEFPDEELFALEHASLAG